MFDEVFTIQGNREGPTSVVLAGVHGDEKCGVEAFQKILPTLTIVKGRVIFLYGNPRAIVAHQRFTEANLNRMFKHPKDLSLEEKESYEYSRAQVLKTYLDQADALLDIHASFTPKSKPFIICEANAREITECMPVDLIISGFDTIEPGGTDFYMNSIGKIGLCVECGFLNDSASTALAEKSIYSFLYACGHITSTLKPVQQSYIHMYDLYTTKTNTFCLSKKFADFELVAKGQIIGVDGEEEVQAERDSIILFAQNVTGTGKEAFLLGEKKNTLV